MRESSTPAVTVRSFADGVWVAAAPSRVPPRDRRSCSRSGAPLLLALVDLVVPNREAARLEHDAGGASRLVDRPGLHVRVSHDGGWLTAALAHGRPVGVDVQEPIPGSGARLVRRCLRQYRPAVADLSDERLDRGLA
jgi:phosphopantetheinyl transferase